MRPILHLLASFYRIYFERGHRRGDIHAFIVHFVHVSQCLPSPMFLFVRLFWSYFYCYVKINADALNVSGVSQDSRGRTNWECGDKGSVSTFGARQSARLLTRSWKHGSVHVRIFRATCKMCWTRVGVQHSFPQMSRLRLLFIYCQMFLKCL